MKKGILCLVLSSITIVILSLSYAQDKPLKRIRWG